MFTNPLYLAGNMGLGYSQNGKAAVADGSLRCCLQVLSAGAAA
jgi:hypothetical protein